MGILQFLNSYLLSADQNIGTSNSPQFAGLGLGVTPVTGKLSLASGVDIRGADANELIKFTQTASAVNEVTIANAATNTDPTIQATGGDTNVNLTLRGQGTGLVRARAYSTSATSDVGTALHLRRTTTQDMTTGFGLRLSFNIEDNAGTSNTIAFVDARRTATNDGSGMLSFFTLIAGSDFEVLRLNESVSSATNYIAITNAATGNAPSLSAIGTDTNPSLLLKCQGTGTVWSERNSTVTNAIYTGLAVKHTTTDSMVDGFGCSLTLYLRDSSLADNIAARISGIRDGADNTSKIRLSPYIVGVESVALELKPTASSVNYAQIIPSATGTGVIYGVEGTDSNIDLSLTPKGTGVLKYGTHSAIGAETVTGYITIKDSAGNTRKLAVVS
jgi:hypothetical protein